MSLISKLFNQNTVTNSSTTLTLQGLGCPAIAFTRFIPGIDNVHIDVYLSGNFTQSAEKAIHALLIDYCTYKKHKVTASARQHLEHFQNSYASMLKAVLYRAKEGKNVD